MKNILVIFGGCSSEYEVSLRSSASVLRNLNKDKYSILTVGITKEGKWYYYEGDVDSIENGTWQNGKITPCVISPNTDDSCLLVLGDKVERKHIDVIFPVLHGKNGEDGTVQGIFELSKIPYVGCGILGSSMCMDKAITNTMADAKGIDQAKWAAFTEKEYRKDLVDLDNIIKELKFPIFVKPANAGSSVGITKAHDLEELKRAIEIAFQNDYKAVLEETLVGREIECAVMGNEEPVASCIGEILPTTEFYDYEAKYITDSTGLQIPAKLDDETSERVRSEAIRAYKALECKGLSRCDFFLLEDGRICLNEINTLPGFTSISMFPKLFGQVGVPYSELLDRLISYAEER